MLFRFLLFGVLLISGLFSSLNAQVISGTITDKSTGKPVAYVNLGVYGKNRGVVSNEQGQFSLDVSRLNDSDTFRISVLSYERRDMSLGEIKKICHQHCRIDLTPKTYDLQEVVITSGKNLKERIVGNDISRKNISAGMADSILGYEFGTVMRIKRKPAVIQEVIMHVARCDYDSVFLRMNIHSVKNGLPEENLLRAPVYVQFSKAETERPIRIDLTSKNIKVQDDFVVSFEVVREMGNGGLYLTGSLLNKDRTIFRPTSQAKWSVLGPIGIGIAARILQEK